MGAMFLFNMCSSLFLSFYHVYQGCLSFSPDFSWDRIVGENYILKNTEENRTLMKKLADTAKR